MGSLRRQLALLGRARGFRLLSLAAFGSGLGTWLAFVALTVDVYDRTHSGAWVSALLVADFVPAIVIGLALGPLVDRLSRRGVMIGSDLTRLAVFAVLPFAPGASSIVALAALAGFATGFFRPAVYAGLPNVVEEADLPAANSLLQTLENATTTIAPLLGGVLVAATSPNIPYWVNAATFLLSAVVISRIPTQLLHVHAAPSRGHFQDLAAGFDVVRRSRALLTVFFAWNVAMFAIAGTNVSEVVLAKVSLDGGDFGFGLLVATAGLGLALGSFAAGPVIERARPATVYGGAIALMAAGYLLTAVSPDVWVAAVTVVLYGIGNGAAVVCNALLVQRGAADEVRGRAFTILMGSTAITLALGMIGAGWLTDAIGARWVWGIGAGIAAAAAVVGYALARGIAPASAPAETFDAAGPVEAHAGRLAESCPADL